MAPLASKSAFNEKAFEVLFKEHFTALVYLSLQLVKDKDAAKDLVHDSFSVLWEKRDEMDSEGNIKSYLYTTVYRKSLNYIRFNKKFQTPEFEQLAQLPHIPDSLMEQAELKKRISDAIQRLPEKTREVFIMSRYKNMKYSEIAQVSGISVKTVEAQMSRALKMLKHELSDYLLWAIFINQIFIE